MIILPALLQKYNRTGVKPVLLCCEEFASILDGVSYVEPFVVYGIPWTTGVRRALAAAREYYDDVYVPKWWDCAGMEPPPPPPHEPFTELDIRGRKIIVSQREWDSYQYSQWKACGFTRQELLDWPLVFDKRDPKREQLLASTTLRPNLPNVIYNFTGISNPMGFEPEVIRALAPLRGRVNFVDLGRVRATRIYDMLGLYDRSLCLISGDTATLHLASASKVPLIALLADGGAGSIVKGNEILRLRYSQVRENVNQIAEKIRQLL
jgi:hypothetical protein